MPETEENPCRERLLRKQLLLLATLVAGVTYVAGVNPPGGVWQENGSGHMTGDTILLATHRGRYLVFYYCNATALAASVMLIFLLLLKKPRWGVQVVVLRIFMVLDLLGLTGAYAAGSSQRFGSTLYILSLVIALTIYLFIQVYLACISRYIPWALPELRRHAEGELDDQGPRTFRGTIPRPSQEERRNAEEKLDNQAPLKRIEWCKVLMLLATFVAVITYVAGLSSPGGYWDRVDDQNQQGFAGLEYMVKLRFRLFFYFNATAFMASLFLIMQLMSMSLLSRPGMRFIHAYAYASALTILAVVVIGLLGGYATVTCRNIATSIYVFCLIASLLAYLIAMISTAWWRRQLSSDATTSTTEGSVQQEEPVGSEGVQLGSNEITRNEEYGKVRSLILLLATLAATATYQAGLHPSGGVWPDDGQMHTVGYPILLSTQPSRYKIFLYCNSGAFVLSMAAITMLTVKNDKIYTTLLVSMILDMVALMGAYAAGNWRDERRSICVVAMACCVIIYVMIHLLCVTVLRTLVMEDTRLMKKRHKRLLLVAILVATVTYQAGLNPPGGFHEDDGNAAGTVLLMDNYPGRFWAFFYCNTVSFMATLALILFFISPNLYRRAVRCYTLYGCIVLALLCLMAAYAAGIVKRVLTYAYVFVLFAMVVTVVGVHTIQSRAFLLKGAEEEHDEDGSSAVFGLAHMPRSRPRLRQIPRPRLRLISTQETKYRQVYASHKHLMLLGILAAGATYQNGLNPPGGLWKDNGDHGSAGSPVLYDSNRKRYLAFFYSNSTSFVASVFIIVLQLQQIMQKHQLKHKKLLALATNTALVLDLLCILAAYTAGAARRWEDAIALFVLVLFCVAIHAAPWIQAILFSRMHQCKATAGTILACITERW